MYCIETENLSHQFASGKNILDNITLQVPSGSIYGFLGPNGAGKTTTLRLILGLLKKQSGRISIFGQTFEKNRVGILRKLGSLIETPSLYGHLTAAENLLLLQKIYQCPKTRIPEVLELVGLSDTAHKKVSQFSLGMKQRLSIAVALLNQPELLILDEPTNGLDPNGIIEMRELFKRLNQEQGITILISSHLLGEIEKLVSHVGIIHKGQLLFEGTLQDLIQKQQESSSLKLSTNDNARALQVLQSIYPEAQQQNGKLALPPLANAEIAAVNRQLLQHGLEVYHLAIEQNDLESIFMELVKN
ncbi:MAG TPA: ABC transporter ATP-binding protein [Haliscomenobacter sp.]|uniref:ABC transporter ATP-binding protein n=1 Tax=Haliscomenobacter sp. TaxID=2717303 RepID=UPI001D459946|nr:ABC transporter ATP-binding protein [Haliscomenobacter sp.]MBK9487722.1 ABC transporter ATP-binding protein [Haliscomenobacter sp.]HOY17930.1 ABC transporter ATP-binding protein [Haliscomenobacter sp.]HPH17696.1 ABC transporter ATP-binding protein [Haliscomenobacter sp.]